MSDHHHEASPPKISDMIPVFVIVCLLAAMASCGVKQAQLKGLATKAVEAGGFEHVAVAFKGTKAVLSGYVSEKGDIEEVRGLVSEIPGVQGVSADRISVGEAPADERIDIAEVKAHPTKGTHGKSPEAAPGKKSEDTHGKKGLGEKPKEPAKPAKPAEHAKTVDPTKTPDQSKAAKVVPLATLVEDVPDHKAGKKPETPKPSKEPAKDGAKKSPRQKAAQAAKKAPLRKVADKAVPAEDRVASIAAALKSDESLKLKIISSSQQPYGATGVVKEADARLSKLKEALVDAGVAEDRIDVILRVNLSSLSKVSRSEIEFHLY